MHYPQCNGIDDWGLTLTADDRAGAAALYGAPGGGGGGTDPDPDPGICLAKSSPCTTADECCSGKCGGKPGKFTCR